MNAKVKRNGIWTHGERAILYELLLEKFGPYEEWEHQTSPGFGREKEYDRFCETFAELIGAANVDAVKYKVNSLARDRTVARHNIGTEVILNKASAYLAGFIPQSNLDRTRIYGPEDNLA